MSSLKSSSRLVCWLMLSLLVLALAPRTASVQAQDKKEKTESAADAETETEEEPAADAHAEGGEAAPAHTANQSQLMWIIHTSGWIGAVLLVISIYFVAVVTQLFLEMREKVVLPPELLEECNALLAKRDYNGIYKAAKDSSSELGQLIAIGLSTLSAGVAEARDAIERTGEALTVEMEKKISMLAVIGSLGPMIGLLGTLKGMIASFSVIATSDQQLKASEVAGGISEALLITFEGVGLSVPAIYFYAVFKNRVATLSIRAINTADEFIRRMNHVAQTKPAAQPAAAPAATAPASPPTA